MFVKKFPDLPFEVQIAIRELIERSLSHFYEVTRQPFCRDRLFAMTAESIACGVLDSIPARGFSPEIIGTVTESSEPHVVGMVEMMYDGTTDHSGFVVAYSDGSFWEYEQGPRTWRQLPSPPRPTPTSGSTSSAAELWRGYPVVAVNPLKAPIPPNPPM